MDKKLNKLDKLNIIKHYSLKGDKFILVAHLPKIKRPALMIGNNFGVIHIATFHSDSTAELFCEWVDECLEINREANKKTMYKPRHRRWGGIDG